MLQWECIFENAITCLDASIHSSCAVIGSETGQLAWIQLDNSTSTTKIGEHCNLTMCIASSKGCFCREYSRNFSTDFRPENAAM